MRVSFCNLSGKMRKSSGYRIRPGSGVRCDDGKMVADGDNDYASSCCGLDLLICV